MVPESELRDILYRFVGHPGGKGRGVSMEELRRLRSGLLPSIRPYLVRTPFSQSLGRGSGYARLVDPVL
jgi:hypothetical protein